MSTFKDYPLFSVIIPTYNSAKTLATTLESAVNQTYSNFEILIIDGLSSDNTLKIANSYYDDRIKIISEKDAGIYDAMNKGIQLAKGEWIYFLGSDDEIKTNFIFELIIKEIDKEKVDVIYGNVDSNKLGSNYAGLFDRKRILYKNICHQSIFYHKSIFNIIGNFNTNYTSYADWDHNMRWLLNKSIQHKYINVVIANYADGGFSEKTPDTLFDNNKFINYFKYGKSSFTCKEKASILKKYVMDGIHSRDFKRIFILIRHLPELL